MQSIKTSKVKTWILRSLLVLVALVAIALLMLKSLGGTSESHRRGLEQAFSDFLKADVRIGQLNAFNLLPQLRFDATDLSATSRKSLYVYKIQDLKLAFGLWDLFLNRGRIEDLEVTDFKFDVGPDLEIAHLGIVRGAQPFLLANGEYQNRNFEASLQMQSDAKGRGSYFFGSENDLKGRFSKLDFNGIFSAKAKNRQSLRDLQIRDGNKLILTGSGGFNKERDFKINLKCKVPKISAAAKDDLNFLTEAGILVIEGDCAR